MSANNIRDNIYNMHCPSCGASMELTSNYRFECPYCKTAFYVYPEKKVQMVFNKYLVDNKNVLYVEDKEEYDRFIKHQIAESIGNYLLENNFIMFEEHPNYMLDNINEMMGAIKVVKPEGVDN